MTPYLSQIQLFPLDYAPDGWHLCDGTILPIVSNVALFSLIGCKFGGDCLRDFALPDYRAISPPGSNYFICIHGTYPVRP